ncbi:hypothetical protein RF11_02710 [Thelohanellus kitauei]|uniref:Twinkle protein, mitochondrial n=1 Tax=Thelohanellus kitauei TaxID=669202 RepID=A0A0C2M5I1_THEKT|nr:hypothetical protein RF11_15320 [Thelohanellus kitauei]KII65290.1 hypothetical protein RF11_02710 [Thelohanellus kitauei]
METNTSNDEIDRIKERLTKKGVIIGIPTERFSDVYGFEDLKDRFFTIVALPRLQPHLFEGLKCVREILIKEPQDRGVGHFIRALAGEYGFHLVTIDGRLFNDRKIESISQIAGDVKSLLIALKPSILFIRNLCDLDSNAPDICYLQRAVSSYCQTHVPSVFTIIACSHRRDVINTGYV